MGKKVYAIKEGFDSQNQKKIENLIVDTWNQCLSYVKGVKGAKYKSFENVEEAKKYLSESSVLLKKSDDNYPKEGLHVYVDGSYNSATEEYSYGMVAVENDVVLYIESGKGKNVGERNIRQIAGELKGAIRATEYALDNNKKEVVIFHDYEGVSHHATGFWERREPSSEKYYKEMQELMAKGIKVTFVKVDSHTGDLFNELVDEKCKEALGINSDKVVEKWLKTNTLEVANMSVKDEILSITSYNEENIKVLEKNKNTCREPKKELDFKATVKEYKKNKEEGIRNIKNLNEDEKTEFILYLLENMSL